MRLLAQSLALPVAYQVFRMGFYGSLVPNTALAKSGGRGQWRSGWWYLRYFAEPYWLDLPLACLALGVGVPFGVRAWRPGDRRGLVALGVLPLVGLCVGLYVVRLGGDYMHDRLLLPALFALVAPLAAVPVTRLERAVGGQASASGRRRLRVGRGSCERGGPAAAPPGRGRRGVRGGAGLGGDCRTRAAPPGRRRLRPAVRVRGLRRARRAARAARCHRRGPGLGPQAVREVLDLGVADPVVSRFALERPGATGHEKPIPAAWLAARVSDDALPEDLLRPPMMSIRLYESPPGRLEDDAAAVRRALGCGELVDLSQAVHDPLIPGRFLWNLVESPR